MSWFAPSSGTAPGVTGANDIPPPRSDTARNAPPENEHQRVVEFVRVRLSGVLEKYQR
jgi:hypothetical protein